MKKRIKPIIAIVIAIIIAFTIMAILMGIFIFNIIRSEKEREVGNAYFKVTIPDGWKADGEDRE